MSHVMQPSSSPLLKMLIDQDEGKQLQLQVQIPMTSYDFGNSVVYLVVRVIQTKILSP